MKLNITEVTHTRARAQSMLDFSFFFFFLKKKPTCNPYTGKAETGRAPWVYWQTSLTKLVSTRPSETLSQN